MQLRGLQRTAAAAAAVVAAAAAVVVVVVVVCGCSPGGCAPDCDDT